MKQWYIIFVIFIIFTGCSSKNVDPLTETIQYQEKVLTTDEQIIEEEDEELFDEFEDEIEVKEIYDPFSKYNRLITHFNDKVYVYFLTPVTKGYNYILHYQIRRSISNFFNNIYYPMRVVNNLLQGKFKNSYEETERFVINSTVGILGLFDPAKNYFNIEAHEEDFGQTLGFYGVGSGPHIVLPFFGPSNLRDSIGIIPDAFLSPIDYAPRDWITLTEAWGPFLSVKAFEYTNNFSLDVKKYTKLKEDSIDLYPYFKDIYEQYRDKQIKE